MLKIFIIIPRAKAVRVFNWVGRERQVHYMIRLTMVYVFIVQKKDYVTDSEDREKMPMILRKKRQFNIVKCYTS